MSKIILTSAPSDWQIIPQHKGSGVITVAGRVTADQPVCVFAGMLDEEDCSPVVEWQRSVTDSFGSFSLSITVPAGGLYRLELKVAESTCHSPAAASQDTAIHHLGVGDIYVIAGQSNAAGVGKGEIEEPLDPMVHVFRDRTHWDIATHPLDFERDRHTPWIAFAHTLARKLHYPIGIVPTAVSGSQIRKWLPEQSGELYRGMMETISNSGAAPCGIIWVQGCSEAMECLGDTYYDSFSSLVSHTRRDLGINELPFFLLQINRRIDYEKDRKEAWAHWAKVREAQRRASHDIPGIYITTSFDARLSDGIHHSSFTNPMLGQRMARQALYSVYGIGVRHDPPQISSAELTQNGIVKLSFDAVHCWQSFGLGGRMPFSLKDDGGDLQITQISCDEKHIYITPSRPIGSGATVSGMPFEEQTYFICDDVTQIPMLGFCDFPISL